MGNLEFFRELYEKELQIKESLANRFTIIISIVTLLFGATVFCFMNINDLENHPILFTLVIIFGIISLLIDALILFLLLIHFGGQDYLILPRAKALGDYYKGLEDFSVKNPNLGFEVDAHFNEYLFNKYIEMADHNFEVNDNRVNRLNLVHTLIIISTMFTLVTFVCYIPYFFSDDSNTQKVDIINSTEIIEVQEVHNEK